MLLHLGCFNAFHTHLDNYLYSTFDSNHNLLGNLDLKSHEICFTSDFVSIIPVTILSIVEFVSIILFGHIFYHLYHQKFYFWSITKYY